MHGNHYKANQIICKIVCRTYWTLTATNECEISYFSEHLIVFNTACNAHNGLIKPRYTKFILFTPWLKTKFMFTMHACFTTLKENTWIPSKWKIHTCGIPRARLQGFGGGSPLPPWGASPAGGGTAPGGGRRPRPVSAGPTPRRRRSGGTAPRTRDTSGPLATAGSPPSPAGLKALNGLYNDVIHRCNG